ncbi:MAG: DUF3857 domain-containing protein [Candidatus Eisenbacteria bacterium]|nr:DUF3857 domain-containing protein [Candidatus Eisenbacteria bacterium]
MRNRIRLALALLFFASGAIAPLLAQSAGIGPLSDEEILRRVRTAPAENSKPDLDALVLFDGVFVSFRDGKAEMRRQRLTRIYTEWAMDELGDPRIAHDRSRQELVIHASRTVLADGRIVDAPENAFNDVTPDGLDRSTDHIDIREMVVTHTGLEPGAMVLLDWTVRDTVPREPHPGFAIFPHGSYPVLEMTIAAEGLHGEVVRPRDALFDIPDAGKEARHLVWRLDDLHAVPPLRGHEGDQLPWIALSPSESWDEVVGPVARSIENAAAEREGLSAAIEKVEKEKPLLGDREALERFAKMAADRTTLVAYGPCRYQLPPRSAQTLLERGTATPLERAVLLLAFCEERDLAAEIIFPGRWKDLPVRTPALGALGHPMLRVAGGHGEVWWVDPTDGAVAATPPFGSGIEYFIINGKEPVRERSPLHANRVEIAVYWDLVSGEGKCEGMVSGPHAADLGIENPESFIEKWLGEWSEDAEAAEVRIPESRPGRLIFSGSAKAPLSAPDDRGRILVALPVAPIAVGDLLPSPPNPAHGTSDRLLFSPAPVEVSVTWKLRAPQDRAVLPGESAEEVCAGGEFSFRRNGEGEIIEANYTLLWDGRSVGTDAYREFRAFRSRVLDERLTRIVLEAKEK